MGFLNSLFSKKKDVEDTLSEVTNSTNTENEGIVGTAEMTATIVAKGLEKGEFSEINKQLEALPKESGEHPQYVFPPVKSEADFFFIMINIILIAVFLYFGSLSVGMIVLSKDFINMGLVGLVVSITFLLLNINLIRESIKRIRFNARYLEYEPVIRFKSVELIEDISVFSNTKEELVVKDLRKAIKLGYIPEGHFGKNNLIFMVSDETNNRYLEKQATYDRYYRKLLEDRHRMGERSQKTQEILDEGQRYVDRIKESNAVIKDQNVTEKLNRMEEIVSMIFHEVDINPKQSDKLGLLLTYYLPTTEKLLESYIDLGDKTREAATVKRIRSEIEKSIDSINKCFEGILEKFYEEKELDIISDISAMEVIMRQEEL